MYVLNAALSKYTLILTLKQIIERDNSDSKQAIYGSSHAMLTIIGLFKSSVKTTSTILELSGRL